MIFHTVQTVSGCFSGLLFAFIPALAPYCSTQHCFIVLAHPIVRCDVCQLSNPAGYSRSLSQLCRWGNGANRGRQECCRWGLSPSLRIPKVLSSSPPLAPMWLEWDKWTHFKKRKEKNHLLPSKVNSSWSSNLTRWLTSSCSPFWIYSRW